MNMTLAPRLLRLQQSLHSGGSQHGSNLNVRLEYIWVKKMTGRKAKDPLAKENFTAKHNRNKALPSMLTKMHLAFYFIARMMAMEGSFQKHSTWITHLE